MPKSYLQNSIASPSSQIDAARILHYGELSDAAIDLWDLIDPNRRVRRWGVEEWIDAYCKLLEEDRELLIDCLLSHLRAEYPDMGWPAPQDWASSEMTWPREARSTLWLVSRRRTFVGTCKICEGWRQLEDEPQGSASEWGDTAGQPHSPSAQSGVPTADMVARFLESKRGFVSDGAWQSYRHTLNAFARHCPVLPSTPGEMEVYLRRYNGGRGAASAYPVLKMLFDFAETRHGCPHALRGVKRPKFKEVEPASFTLDQFKAILEACADDRELALVHLEGGHGLRPNEAISINFDDIGETDLFIAGGKVRQEFTPLLPETREVLLRLGKGRDGAIFRGRSGERLSDRSAYAIVDKVLKRAGISGRYSPYSLRHSFSTLTQEAGMDYVAAQRLMRHRKRTMTEHYTHLGRDYLRRQLETYSPLRLVNGQLPKIFSCST